MTEKLYFRVAFRPMVVAQNICDNCETQVTAWYNELLTMGYCKECMTAMQEDYNKNGGD